MAGVGHGAGDRGQEFRVIWCKLVLDSTCSKVTVKIQGGKQNVMIRNTDIITRVASVGIVRKVASTDIVRNALASNAAYHARKIAIKGVKAPFSLDRDFIAKTYIKGDGIEIGALHAPLRVSKRASVKYVDRMSVPDLRQQYPELSVHKLVHVDIIDDGELLKTIEDSTQDFVIANHFLEHCQNPIGAIHNILRVLRGDGIIYLAIPDKRYTFDVDRPVTTLDHLLKDYEQGPEWSKRQHFEEWTRTVDRSQRATEVARLMDIDYSIHYHVWTQTELLELMTVLKTRLGFQFDLELFFKTGNEAIFVLRKT
jgi:predicted SAM-dependent methyltransferase